MTDTPTPKHFVRNSVNMMTLNVVRHTRVNHMLNGVANLQDCGRRTAEDGKTHGTDQTPEIMAWGGGDLLPRTAKSCIRDRPMRSGLSKILGPNQGRDVVLLPSGTPDREQTSGTARITLESCNSRTRHTGPVFPEA